MTRTDDQEHEAKRFPFDVESLKKGDTVYASELEDITRCKRTEARYALKILRLRDRLERELEVAGKPATVRILGGELVILTDAEASQYNYRRVVCDLRAIIKSHLRNLNVDETKLPPDIKAMHERRLIAAGHYIAALHQARKEIPKVIHERSTPGLLE